MNSLLLDARNCRGPVARRTTLAENVVDAGNKREDVGLDLHQRLAGETGLELLRVALALASAAFCDPVVDEQLLRGSAEVVEAVDELARARPSLLCGPQR